LVDESSSQVLNFTHRTSHGEDGDLEGHSGKYARLAKESLERLKAKYPEVFSEPKYPVSREGCDVNIKHQIRLVDESAPPPKRRIYPLDNSELEELKKQL
jgi:hypothetical protein